MAKPAPAVGEIVHYVGEPERRCGNCEHWRGDAGKQTRECRNMISQKMKTRSDETCRRGFYPSVSRFPLEVRYHHHKQGNENG